MNENKLYDIARGNIERHLGDVADEDSMYDEAYTLAHDALIGAGVEPRTASRIAQDIATSYAQP